MNKLLHLAFQKNRFATILLVLAFFLQEQATAQIKIKPSTINLEDTLKFDQKTQGILNKIIRPVKFRANRDRNEKDRVYHFMLDLVKKGQLNIDSATVNEIMIQLDTIDTASKTNKKSIEDLISTNKLDKKASKAVVDSLKTQMTAVIQENADSNNQKKRDLISKVNDYLKKIRTVQYSCASGLGLRDTILKRDTVKKVDTLLYREICLEPKIKIIGWYNSWMKDEYLNYNYNYLQAINLYGYELGADGTCENRDDLDEFQKPGGIIEYTKNQACNLLLTVYSKNPTRISKFLGDQAAQNMLIGQLDTLIDRNNLNGINIYFDFVSPGDKEKFVQFITKLYQNLKNKNGALSLDISVPPIKDDESLTEISAYNFQELNPMVNYYLVLTDRMVGKNTALAQSMSPLFNSDKYGKHTIESTIGFYSNGKIPVSKLIMTVSYLGTGWQVDDFSGELKTKAWKDLEYSGIYENYINKKVSGRTVIEGFDPDQVSAYLNVAGKNPADKMQIWFEDFRSLYLKYNWALENGLGGVSIRGLGYDDGYSELWNIMGAALIKIDTTVVNMKIVKQDSTLKALKLADYLKVFFADFEWAVAADLEYHDPKTNGTCDCLYNEDSIRKYRKSPLLWHEWQPYNSKATNKDTGKILNSSLTCKCLFARWDIYASIFRWTWIISLGTITLLYLFSRYFERYKLGTRRVRDLIKIAQGLFFIVFIFTISFWLYLSPSVALIGASSSGSNIGILFIALFFGGLLGWITNSWYNKNKRVPKNLP